MPGLDDPFSDSSFELDGEPELKTSTQTNNKGSGREYITSFTTTTIKPDVKKGVEVIKGLVEHSRSTSAPSSAIQSLTTMRSNKYINTQPTARTTIIDDPFDDSVFSFNDEDDETTFKTTTMRQNKPASISVKDLSSFGGDKPKPLPGLLDDADDDDDGAGEISDDIDDLSWSLDSSLEDGRIKSNEMATVTKAFTTRTTTTQRPTPITTKSIPAKSTTQRSTTRSHASSTLNLEINDIENLLYNIQTTPKPKVTTTLAPTSTTTIKSTTTTTAATTTTKKPRTTTKSTNDDIAFLQQLVTVKFIFGFSLSFLILIFLLLAKTFSKTGDNTANN